jgi:hypothetical protein
MAPRSGSAFLALQKPIEAVRDDLRKQYDGSDVERVRDRLLSDFHKLVEANEILDLPALENFEARRAGGDRPPAGKKKMAGNKS